MGRSKVGRQWQEGPERHELGGKSHRPVPIPSQTTEPAAQKQRARPTGDGSEAPRRKESSGREHQGEPAERYGSGEGRGDRSSAHGEARAKTGRSRRSGERK